MEPVKVEAGLSFDKIAAGGYHTCGISDGSAYCWGNNDNGQLGIGGGFVNGDPYNPPPELVESERSFKAISAGDFYTCGIATDGFAHCWGEGQYGQLGNGSYSDRGVPDMVAGGHAFDQISSGNQHTCGITVGGQAYCWGSGSYGRLGSGSNDITNIPVLVSSPLEPRKS